MRYISVNYLDDFEFHDTIFRFRQYRNNILVVSAEYLNIHKGTEQNKHMHDMEIDAAVITFEKFEVESVEILKPYEMDAEGHWHTKDPDIQYTGENAKKALIAALEVSCSINGLDFYRENARIVLDFDANGKEYFQVRCFCENVKIEWDEYRGIAWYEKSKQ